MFATARPENPQTSHDAGAKQWNNQNDRAIVLEAYFLGDNSVGMNDWELADKLGRQQNSVGKRRTELRDAGLIVDIGQRRVGHTKSKCIVWGITEFGSLVHIRSMPLDNASLESYAIETGMKAAQDDTGRQSQSEGQPPSAAAGQ